MALASKAKGEGRGGDFLRDALTKSAQLIEEVSRADAGSILLTKADPRASRCEGDPVEISLQMVRPRAARAGLRNPAVTILSVRREICESLNEGKRVYWLQEPRAIRAMLV